MRVSLSTKASRRRRPGRIVAGGLAAVLALTLAPFSAAAVAAADPLPVAADSILPQVGAGTNFVDRAEKLDGYFDPEWYEANVPFLDVPDAEIEDVYYYRWRVWKEHLRYTSPDNGWILTEFLDCCGYAAPYQAINAAAGHQIDEGRWVRDQSYLDDYEQFWLTGPGQISPAQNPEASNWAHQYSFWAVSAVVDRARVTGNVDRLKTLQDDLVKFYRDWDNQYDAEIGLYWQTPEYDAKEYSPASYVTDRTYQGRHTFRPSINAYQYGDAQAIVEVAGLTGDTALAAEYTQRAADLKAAVMDHLWDPERKFFYDIVDWNNPDRTQLRDRLDVGFAPWKFGLADGEQADALEQLFDPQGFAAPFGPTTVERRSPDFYRNAAAGCCKWDGPSWPFSTAITLDGVGELLHSDSDQTAVTEQDFVDLLKTYTRTQYKNGKPYVAEAHQADSDAWIYDGTNHSEDYLHSSYTDLVISRLIGLQPQLDDTVLIDPIVPASWTHFALENVPYHGRNLTVLWDADGSHYGQGAGFKIYVDGELRSATAAVGEIVLPVGDPVVPQDPTWVNIAANPLQAAYPKPSASNTWRSDTVWSAIDGKLWYTEVPQNTRWTNWSSPNQTDWYAVEFASAQPVGDVRYYSYDDGGGVKKPASFQVQYLNGTTWTDVPQQTRIPAEPVSNGLNRITFPAVETTAVRLVFAKQPGSFVGISELQVWVPGSRAITASVAADDLKAGAPGTVSVQARATGAAVTGADATLTMPTGWTAQRISGPAGVDLARGDSATWTYRVQPPATLPPGAEVPLVADVSWTENGASFDRTATGTAALEFDSSWYRTVALDDTFDSDTSAQYTVLKPRSDEPLPTLAVGNGSLSATGPGRFFGMYSRPAALTADSLVIVDIDRFALPASGSEDSITFGLAKSGQVYVQAWLNKKGGTAGTDHVNNGGYLGGAAYFGPKDFAAGDRVAFQLHGTTAAVFHGRDGVWTRWGSFTVDPALNISDLSQYRPFVGLRSDGGTVAVGRLEVRTAAAAVLSGVEVSPRCLNKTAMLALRATNVGTGPVDVRFTTAHGTKATTALGTGKTAQVLVQPNLAGLPAGTATVTATWRTNGQEQQQTWSVPYAAVACR